MTPALKPVRSTDRFHWFSEDVGPHEPALRAFLRGRFPSITDHDDIVQETYARLVRVREDQGLRNPKAFLFVAARNAALDVCRRKRPISMEEVSRLDVSSALVEDSPDASELVNRDQELAILADAVRALPARCRQVIVLRWFDGLAYKQIATRLSISPGTVKVHIAKGMRRCIEYFRQRGLL